MTGPLAHPLDVADVIQVASTGDLAHDQEIDRIIADSYDRASRHDEGGA